MGTQTKPVLTIQWPSETIVLLIPSSQIATAHWEDETLPRMRPVSCAIPSAM